MRKSTIRLCRSLTLVTLAVLFTGNLSTAKQLAEEGKDRMDSQILSDGKMPKELARTNGLWYSTYNLQAFFALATLAQSPEELASFFGQVEKDRA